MPNFAARQLGRQHLALGDIALGGLFVLRAGRALGLERLDLLGKRLQVGVEVFFEEAALRGLEPLGLGSKAQPLERSHLEGEFVDQRLLEPDLCDQGRGQIPQLGFVEAIEFFAGGSKHGSDCASRAREGTPSFP